MGLLKIVMERAMVRKSGGIAPICVGRMGVDKKRR